MNKKLYKIVLTLILLVNTNNIFADGNCTINDSPDYINDFIQNINKANSNINSAASKGKSNDSNAADEYFGYINSIYKWTTNEIKFLYIKQESTQEIPNQVKRDVKRLEKLQKKIELKKPESSKTILSYSDICKGIDENICNFEKNENYSAGKAIVALKKSINMVNAKLQDKATEVNLKSKQEKIYLFPIKNIKKLNNDYSKINLKMCSITEDNKGKKGFFGQILDMFKNVSWTKDKDNDAFAEWRAAIALLNEGSPEEGKKQKKEKEQTKKQLKKQGVGGTAGEATLKNNKDYNKDSNDNSSGEAGFLNSLLSEGEQFTKTLKKLFPEMDSEDIQKSDHKESLTKIKKQYKNINKEQSIIIPLRAEYKKLKDLALKEDIKNDIFIDRLIDMHINLSQAINTASKTCRISQKVCNDQLTGKGDCGKCY